MTGPDRRHDAPSCDACLAEHRDAVDRLLAETVDELGPQPMPPEAASMLALLATALPMLALLLPAAPVTLQVWQVGLTLVAVWAVAFCLQRRRYDRFDAHLQGKLFAHRVTQRAAEAAQRRSGQTTGGSAATKRLVIVSAPRSIASTISSRPTRTISPRIERPSSSQTSVEPSIQRQGASR
jgi:hypothetical protein